MLSLATFVGVNSTGPVPTVISPIYYGIDSELRQLIFVISFSRSATPVSRMGLFGYICHGNIRPVMVTRGTRRRKTCFFFGGKEGNDHVLNGFVGPHDPTPPSAVVKQRLVSIRCRYDHPSSLIWNVPDSSDVNPITICGLIASPSKKENSVASPDVFDLITSNFQHYPSSQQSMLSHL